ncbi:3-carboxy-cis,cis-muconate cycloisomerase [Amycolatopsis rhabdoformis]|uniref:3-carboxy-cis,cis-muconate cycloisomerase n=1 Tax=Amycolatopsis rhabdoformis TaxID=1448059 RepID=A0ABZ1I3L2_9PSEU|nr:3-carboxy-cis,cis-muconate cycloisomerase [Amycolatopsis rhabdoformis]WSE28764.1 3-carboxy-cis,cis-muconate cycloisomerase [Amycolatopsis rhabdoformis]
MSADPDSGLLSPVRAGTPVERVTGDNAVVAAMLAAEAALARAQARLGTVPAEAAAAITAAAAEVARVIDVPALAEAARGTANPVVALVKQLTAAVGADHADSVHRGSTSQDIVDTALMIVARDACELLEADLAATAAALGELAREHRDTVMPGRTLTAHAVPTTFGLKAAGWRQYVLDSAERVRRLALPVSLGGAAGTLAAYVEYGDGSEDYAERLVAAFGEEANLSTTTLPWHANRTPVADLVAALAQTATALGKFAVDVQVLTRTEIGEVSEPTGGGSSAMPHKRNPVLSALIRSAALQVPVLAAGVTQSGLAEDERSAGVWQAEWQLLRECLRLTGGAAHTAVELARGLAVHADRMREDVELTHGLIVSERLSAALAPLLGKARAKDVLGEASKRAVAESRPLREVLGSVPEIADVLDPAKLDGLLDPAQYTGAAARLVDRALDGHAK